MKAYTFIIEYCGFVDSFQAHAENIENAVLEMIKDMHLPKIKEKRKAKLLAEINRFGSNVVPIKKMRNIWCFNEYVHGHCLMATIIESSIDNAPQGNHRSLYSFVSLFKGGTFVQQIEADDLSGCIIKWTSHILCKYFDKGQRLYIRKEIKNICQNQSHSDGVGLIDFYFTIDGNPFRLYVIDSSCDFASVT